MMDIRILIVLILIGAISLVLACKKNLKSADMGQTIVDRAIEKQGGQKLEKAAVTFRFRDKTYEYIKNEGSFRYSRTFEDSLGIVKDILTNEGAYRLINESPVELPDTQMNKYANSVNSVLYFAFLPYRLNDHAAVKTYMGQEMIKGKMYEKVQVTFKEEGGGEDFDDVFVYWFDKTTYTLDYLAYEFHVNEGGVRFRAAYNQREVNGVWIQDYINYKPEDETTPVETLGQLYEKGVLKELSKIVLEDVEVQ